jgi:hypothetical protein
VTGATFDTLIRAAAGYGSAPPPPAPERPIGHLGIGRGGTGTPQPRPTSNEEINRRIRAGIRVVRDVQIRGGIVLGDLAPRDLWNG